jgi:hypothetical protein
LDVHKIGGSGVGIPELADALNAASCDYEVSGLQDMRMRLHGLARRPCRELFSQQSTHADYAFHAGARGQSELQFNVGNEFVDGLPVVRHGVAFSLELSQTLPSIDPLRPKIARFNDYVRSNPEDFPGLSMWYYARDVRSADGPVAPIDEALVVERTFIFLGRWVPAGQESVPDILADFDRLLPLWCYVEAEHEQGEPASEAAFAPGCPTFVSRTTATAKPQTVDVALRHKVLQLALYRHLCREAGEGNVAIEHSLDFGVRVDAAVRSDAGLTFYEVKVAPTVQSCVRAALGQLLEYSYWPSANRASELIVVGEPAVDESSRSYLQLLRVRFALPVWYRRIDVDGCRLEPPA